MNEARPKSLLRNITLGVAGGGFLQACQFVVVILIAKLATPDVQGLYNAALAVVTPIAIFFAFELRTVFVADARGEFSLAAYRRLRVMLLSAMALGICAAAWAVLVHRSEEVCAAVLAVGAMRAALCAADLYWGAFQRHERFDWLMQAGLLRGVLLVAFFAVALLATRSAEATLLPSSAVILAAAITASTWWLAAALDARRAYKLEAVTPFAKAQWAAVGRIAARGFPLGAVALIIALADSYPRLVLMRFDTGGAAALGKYAALASVPLAASIFVVQVTASVANRVSAAYAFDRRRFRNVLIGLLSLAGAIGALLLVVALLAGEVVLSALYSGEYAAHAAEFRWICAAGVVTLLTNVLGMVVTQTGRFWAQVPIHVVVLAATIAAAEWFIKPERPLDGVVMVALIRAGFQFLLYAAIAWFAVRTAANADEPRPSGSGDSGPPA